MTRTHEDLCTFVIISRSILLGMTNVSEFAEKIKHTFDLFLNQPTNAQLTDNLLYCSLFYCSCMFRHYCVIFREIVVNTY